jgi:hypothetical protein
MKVHIFLAYFLYFDKIGLCDHPAACVSVYPPINFWMPDTWYVYHDTWAHLNGVLHKSLPSVCVSVCVPLIIARQRLDKNVTAATTTHVTKKICWMRHFLCGPCRIKGKQASSSSQSFFLNNVICGIKIGEIIIKQKGNILLQKNKLMSMHVSFYIMILLLWGSLRSRQTLPGHGLRICSVAYWG